LRILDPLRRYGLDGTGFFVALEPENTTEKALRAGLSRFFTQVRPPDTALVVFEGHGLNIGGRSYLIAADDSGRGDHSLTVEELLAVAGNRSPANIVLLLDACHSGQGRGLAPDALVGRPGVSVLSACDLNEEALEVDELGGGLFSFMVGNGLAGAAGSVHAERRVVTVASLFNHVAREVPAWVAGNGLRYPMLAQRSVTPRLFADLRGDPVLTSVPRQRRLAEDRLPLGRHRAAGENRQLVPFLAPLRDLANVVAARVSRLLGRDRVFLDAGSHQEELEVLLGRFLADLRDGPTPVELTPFEIFVLRAGVCLHDCGLLDKPAAGRFRRAAAMVRSGRVHDLPLVLPDDFVCEAVARVLEYPNRQASALLTGAALVRTDLLGAMFHLAHPLAVMNERLADDVGGGEVGRSWVRRPLLGGITDWDAGAAIALAAPKLNDVEWSAVERWHAQATTTLASGRPEGFGPAWIDIRRG